MAPKLIEIPLGPFTSPTGPKNYPCHCHEQYYGDFQKDCEDCHGTGRVTGDYTPCQRASSEDDRIDPDKWYLAYNDGCYAAGYFSEQHYGWSFSGFYDAGIQLDMIEKLWEIVEDNK